jgi:hypothetical protein
MEICNLQGCNSSKNHCLSAVPLVLANFSDEELPLTKTTNLVVTQEISENLLVSVNEEKNEEVCSEQLFLLPRTKKL